MTTKQSTNVSNFYDAPVRATVAGARRAWVAARQREVQVKYRIADPVRYLTGGSSEVDGFMSAI